MTLGSWLDSWWDLSNLKTSRVLSTEHRKNLFTSRLPPRFPRVCQTMTLLTTKGVMAKPPGFTLPIVTKYWNTIWIALFLSVRAFFRSSENLFIVYDSHVHLKITHTIWEHTLTSRHIRKDNFRLQHGRTEKFARNLANNILEFA